MRTNNRRKMLLAAGLGLGVLGLLLGSTKRTESATAEPVAAPKTVTAFELARVLADGSPDVAVLVLGQPKTALDGAVPAGPDGATDDQIVTTAPRHRAIILAGADPVRTDRLARRLVLAGRVVSVLDGGLDAWDRTLAEDPPAPGEGATGAAWDDYRARVALRRRFGETSSTPAPVITAPLPTASQTGAAPKKKREGC
ncbi:hypothetical protein L6R52_31980 [Myxococcota bacterium]|nr:hypothetical protein [Myxococcota bacterium]